MISLRLRFFLLCGGLVALSATMCRAQRLQPGTAWTVAPSVSRFHWLDQQGSPLRYQATPAGALFQYARTGNHWSWQGRLVAQAGGLRPTAYPRRLWYSETPHPDGSITRDSFPIGGTLAHAQVRVGLVRTLKQSPRLRAEAGIAVEAYVAYPLGLVRTGYVWANALLASGQGVWQPADKWLVTGVVSLPVVAVVTRLPYHNTLAAPGESTLGMFFHQGTHVVSPRGYTAPAAVVTVQRQVSGRVALGISYDFRWLRVAPSLPLYMVQSGFSVQCILHPHIQ